MEHTIKTLITLSIAFLLASTEEVQTVVPISGLIAVMTLGIGVQNTNYDASSEISNGFRSLWSGAEILLFVLVGAEVNLAYALKLGPIALVTIILCLMVRMIGVYVSLLGTNLKRGEKIFSMLAYTPKATVQAAIGAIPLSMGLKCGPQVLTVAVLAILFTAPFGAFMIDRYKYLIK